jgi:hypothetical protein
LDDAAVRFLATRDQLLRFSRDNMPMKILLHAIILLMPFISGCAGTLQEIITCDPPQAHIYWGKTKSTLEKTGHKTPYSRSVSGSNWEPWCYQAKKDGYHESEIICREEEGYRYLDFRLAPFKTTITSEPPDATIYWGPSEEQIGKTTYRTPRTVTVKDHPDGASWKDWYYQVKKDGFHDSEIVFMPLQAEDRKIHIELEPLSRHPLHKTE